MRDLGLLILAFTLALQAMGQKVLLQTGHFGEVVQTELTENGNTLVTAGSDGRVLFWDVKSRLQVKSVPVFNTEISNFCYNEKANILVAGNYDGYVKILDLNTNAEEPIFYDKRHSYITSTDISKDGNNVVIASADRSLILFQKGTPSEITLSREISSAIFSPDNAKLYLAMYKKGVYSFDLTKKFTSENLVLVHASDQSISTIDIGPAGKSLTIGYAGENGRAGKLEVIHINKKKVLHSALVYYPYLGAKPNSIKYLDSDRVLFLDSLEEVSLYDIKKKRYEKYLSLEIKSFSYHSISKRFVYAKDNVVKMFYNGEKDLVLQFEGHIQKPVRLMAASSDSLFVEYENGIKLWSLSALKLEMFEERFYKKNWRYHHISPNLKYRFSLSSLRPFNRVGRSLNTSYYGIFKIVYSPDCRKVAVLDRKGHFQVYSTVDYIDSSYSNYKMKPLIYGKVTPSELRDINYIRFSEDGSKVAVCGKNVKVYDLDSMVTNKVAYGYRKSSMVLPVFFPPNSKELWVGSTVTRYDSFSFDENYGWSSIKRKKANGEVHFENRLSGIATVWSLDSFKYLSYIHQLKPNKFKVVEVKSFIYLKSLNCLNVFYSDNSVLSGSLDSGMNTWKVKKLNCYGIETAMKSFDEKFVYVMTSDGGIKILNPSNLHEICTIYSLKDGDFLVMNAKNHYKRSKNVANAIAFEENGEYVRISEYDKYFNRPYEIMEGLGFVNEAKIALVKRLAEKKVALDSMKVALANKPKLKVVNLNDIDLNTRKKYAEIEFDVKGLNALEKIMVRVNGVPVFGEVKPFTAPSNRMKWNGKLKVPLSYGKNKITLKAEDSKGLQSNEVNFTLNCNKPFVRPDLHLIILSVSDYKDAQYNLRYAVKDGRDLLHTYLEKNGDIKLGPPNKFENVYVDTLFNRLGTKDNFFALRERLQKTKQEDHVYIYVSGHGLLDSNYNFWFATYDVDFDSPYKRGLAFDSIEGILDGIPARQRLILMDACHSGEVLSNEVVSSEQVDLPYGAKGKVVGFTYRGTIIQDEGEEKEDASAVKQELFSNYTSKSGATVISAAAGNSYALESEEWSNGIFTYSILAGLTERLADLNNDGEVSVIELSRFVNKEVKEKTEGQQIPNDRQENIENNFRLW